MILDGEPHVVAAVVGHIESRDVEFSNPERNLLEDRGVVFLDSSGYGVAAQQSVEHTRGAV